MADTGWVIAVAAAGGVAVAVLAAKLAARRTHAPADPPTRRNALPVSGVTGVVSRYVSQRLGRRGTLLTLLGGAYGLYGAGQFLSGPSTRFGDLGPFLTGLLNSHATGWLWLVGGTIGVVFGVRPRHESDAYGFAAVFIPLAVWTLIYDVSWITGLVTGGTYGNSNAWVTSIVWTAQAIVLLVIAGWPDPEAVTGVDGE